MAFNVFVLGGYATPRVELIGHTLPNAEAGGTYIIRASAFYPERSREVEFIHIIRLE
jgi:hypothetical protein